MKQETAFEPSASATWPVGASQTAMLLRHSERTKMSLGPPATWTPTLRVLVDLILASHLPMAILWGPNLVLIYNDAYAPILVDEHPRILGRPAREQERKALHISDATINRVLKGETVSLTNQLIRISNRGGTVDARFTFSYSPVRDETGRIAGLLATTVETMDQDKAEAVLRESEERYRQLSEALPQIVWSSDAEGNVDFFNSRWFAYTGLRDEEGYSAGWECAIHPEDRARVLKIWEEARRSGRSCEIEYRLRRADGVYCWHLDRAVPVQGSRGQVVRWFGTFTDIDDRKHAEEALRESEERFRQFAENSSAVLWVLDVESMTLEYLSPSFQQVWGEPLDVVPRDFLHWIQSVHPNDRDDVVAALTRVRQEGEVIVKEYRVIRPDGTVRWIQNTGFPILDEHGTVKRVAGIAQDVTRHNGSMVYIVDSDPVARRSRSLLFQGAGYQVKTFSSAEAFLEVAPVLVPGCVILDVKSPNMSGLILPRELKARRIGLPVVVIGEAQGDVSFGVQAMKAGAVDFLDVPHDARQLLDAVASALAGIRDIAERDQAAELAKARIAALSSREREVLERLLAGGTNKTIARDLDISPRTVEAHRARIMERLGAQSLPELVQIAMAAGLTQGVRPSSNEGER